MKRENKQYKRIAIIGLILGIILSISFISAVSGGIGNGKVVLNAKVGDIIEKSVKVINYDNISVNIELSGAGDLKDQFKFKKNNFTLAPKEETDVGYSLRVTKEGRSDSQINVKFIPTEGKNGIILPASVIIFAAKGNSTTLDWTDLITGDNNMNDINKTNGKYNPKDTAKINPIVIGLFATAIVFVILLVLLIFYIKYKGGVKLNNKKRQ